MSAEGTQYETLPGLRSLTPQSSASRQAARGFRGLPPGINRSDLMRALEEGGAHCGLTEAQVKRLVYLVRYTAEIDWQDSGAMPVVWVSVAKMAHDLGVSRQRIAAVERQLAEAGWVSHRDAPDRRRRGERDPETGCIVQLNTFGVELGALGARYGELAAGALRRGADWAVRRDLRRSSSALRCEIRRLHAAFDGEVLPGDIPVDALPDGAPLEALEDEHAALRALRDRLTERMAALAPPRLATPGGETQGLPSGKQDIPPILVQTEQVTDSVGNRPTGEDANVGAGAVDPMGPDAAVGDDGPGRERSQRLGDPGDCGVRWLTPDRVAAAASPRFRDILAAGGADDPGWIDLLETADIRRQEIGIHDGAWRAAARALGWAGAATLVAVIDGRRLERASFVFSPPAFATACARLATAGELHLHRSIWGLETRRLMREARAPGDGVDDARLARGIRR